MESFGFRKASLSNRFLSSIIIIQNKRCITSDIILGGLNISQEETFQKTKGIWIQKENPLYYSTWLKERQENVIGFIPFEHPYDPMYLGSVGFLDLGEVSISSVDLDHGLLQNHFYPFGGTARETRPELVGKGLARRIEFEIAKDLSKSFPEDTPIVIGATSDSHLEYCQRIGIVPFKAMSLCDYVKLLDC